MYYHERPTSPFTTSGAQTSSIDEFYVVKKCRTKDFEALELRKLLSWALSSSPLSPAATQAALASCQFKVTRYM